MLCRGVSADQEITQDTLRFEFFAPADSGSIKAAWLDITELCLRQTAGSKTTSTTSSVPGYADQDITLTPCMAAQAGSGGTEALWFDRPLCPSGKRHNLHGTAAA